MSKKSKFLESVHQAVTMRALDKAERDGWPLSAEGDQNSAKRGSTASAIAKLTGLKPGAPDVRVLLEKGSIAFYELKTEVGRVSDEQKDRHQRYRDLGHHVKVIQEVEPLDTAKAILFDLAGLMGWESGDFINYAETANREVMEAIGK